MATKRVYQMNELPKKHIQHKLNELPKKLYNINYSSFTEIT